MIEIRIVDPGKTRGYPYPVCKNNTVRAKWKAAKSLSPLSTIAGVGEEQTI